MLLLYLSLIDNEQDKSKFEIIYYEYRDVMMDMALSVLHNKTDAEDALQDTFIRIAKNIDAIDNAYSERTLAYVLKAVKNSAINYYNKNSKERVILIGNADNIPDDFFLENLRLKEQYNDVINAIIHLDDKYRDVLFYHYVYEMKVKDIAELLGRKTSTVKQQLVRGKKLLLQVLGENYND